MNDIELFDLLMENDELIPLDLVSRLLEQGFDVDEMIENFPTN